MAYASQHLLLRFTGTIGVLSTDDSEVWGAGVRIFIGPGPFEESEKQAFLTAIAVASQTFWTDSNCDHHGSAWLQALTAAYIGIDGKYIDGDDQETTKHVYISPQKGGGVATLPYSHAMAYTLKTDIPRGPGSSGRFYMPSGLTVDSSGRWSAAQVGLAAVPARTWLDAVNTAARAIWSPASNVSVYSNKGLGLIGTVLRVGVGRAPDTQRRRDNKLLEEHVFEDLTTTALRANERANRVYPSSVPPA